MRSTISRWRTSLRYLPQFACQFGQVTSRQHFLDLLRDNDLPHYERGDKAVGVEYGGVKFRFSRLLEDNKFDSLPFDRSEEERTLADIRAIRERQRDRDERNRELGDMERAR